MRSRDIGVMKKLTNMVTVFILLFILPVILYANSGVRPIPDELLVISCGNTEYSPKIFSAIKSAYSENTNCDYKFKFGLRLRVTFLNIINSHYREYHYSRREFCLNVKNIKITHLENLLLR